MYTPRGSQLSYTFPLRITCKKKRGREGVQIACKIAYVFNRKPPLRLERGGERVMVTGRTKTVISWLIYKLYRCLIHQKIAFSQDF